MYSTVEVEYGGGVATVSLNRPPVRNAFNQAMIAELTDIFQVLAQNAEVRVVVLRGLGRSFSAGADASWMQASLDFSLEDNIQDARRMAEMFATMNALPQPLVGRVHHAALGGGMGLIAVCDIVVAADDAIFGFTEGRLGIIPSVISSFVLPKIGESWARATFLTAERFGAEVATRMGLVHHTVAIDDLDAVVARTVADILRSGPNAVREAKRLIRDVLAAPPHDRLSITSERIAAVRASAEGQEGLRAFLEKRSPAWERSD